MSKFITKFVTGLSTVAMATSMLIMPATTHAATAGEVYKTTDGTVYFIDSSMQKRAFTSWGAFESYGFLSAGQIQNMTDAVMALPSGALVAPQDGRIFCATATKDSDVKGECSLITGGKKAAFTSAAVFGAQGFSFANAYNGDSSFLAKTANIDNGSAAHSAGVLVNNGGTIQLVVSGGLWGTPSMDVFNSWGWKMSDVVTANAADKMLTQTGVIAARTAGQLSPSAATTPVDDNGPLEGGVGSITVTPKSTYSSEQIGEGENGVGVLAFEIEAGDDSDVQINSMKVELKQTNTADSRRIEDYIDEVSIQMNGDEVGTADPSDFTENSKIYTKSVSLSGAIVRAGDTATFTVHISALSNLDSGDIDSDSFGVDVLNVRFIDGDGVTTTEDTDADALDRTFDFASFASTANVELKAALNDSDEDINLAHVIDVDDTSDTNNVEILSFTLEAAGDSDINITSIPVNIDVTGAANVDDMITNITLVNGTDEYSSNAFGSGVGADETYTFDDLNIDISAGDTAEFKVTVDFKSTGDVDLDNGDTISAQLSGTEVDAIEATDEAGDDVTTSDLTGTAVGEASAAYDAGIMVTYTDSSAERTFTADASGEDDQGTFKVQFDVTAFDGDMYIDKSSEVANANAAGQGVEFSVTSTAGTPVLSSNLLESDTTKVQDNSNVFYVKEGTTRHFTLTVIYAADSTPTDGSAYIKVESINWGTANDNTNANYYEFNLNDFKTDALFLNGIA